MDTSESGSGSGYSKDDDDGGGGITTTGIVMMTIGTCSVISILTYIFWPSIKKWCRPTPTPIITQVTVEDTAPAAQDAL